MFTIGDLAQQTGVKIPTIRYYENMGLLPEAERSRGNQRRYGARERDRLAFIKHSRDLGFPIEAIRDLLTLNGLPDRPCDTAHGIAIDQLRSVREKIAQLKVLETELTRITTELHEGNRIKHCSVIKSLASQKINSATGVAE